MVRERKAGAEMTDAVKTLHVAAIQKTRKEMY